MIWLGDASKAGPGWPHVYKVFAERFGWTPDQINNLTLFQMSIYLGGITLEHGRLTLKGDDAKRYMARVKKRDNV